jgi:hypothetical protein
MGSRLHGARRRVHGGLFAQGVQGEAPWRGLGGGAPMSIPATPYLDSTSPLGPVGVEQAPARNRPHSGSAVNPADGARDSAHGARCLCTDTALGRRCIARSHGVALWLCGPILGAVPERQRRGRTSEGTKCAEGDTEAT